MVENKVAMERMEIPTWALPYLANGNSDNLTPIEVSIVNMWCVFWSVIQVIPDFESGEYFSHGNCIDDSPSTVIYCDVLFKE